MSLAFIDTNVLLYAVSSAPQEAAKRDRARALLESENWTLSVQVLQEFYVNAVGKLARPLSREAAERFVRHIMTRDPLPITADLVLAGIAVTRRFRLSYWDAAIVAAAKILQCQILFSEDLQHGQDFGGVQVMNPFRVSPSGDDPGGRG